MKTQQHQRSEDLAVKLSQLYSLSPTRMKNSEEFRGLMRCPDIDRVSLLASIPSLPTPSYRPLYLLFILLTELPGPWPTFALVHCHKRLVQNLPDRTAPDHDGDTTWLINATQDFIKQSYNSLADFLWRDDRPALLSPRPDQYITHHGLNEFVTNFNLPVSAGHEKPVIAISLPNGPLLAAICFAVSTYYTAALVDPASSPDEFQADLVQAGASIVITSTEDYERLQLHDANVSAMLASWDGADGIELRDVRGRMVPTIGVARPISNSADDVSMILLRTGSCGTKEVVSFTAHDMMRQAVSSMDAWGLLSSDVGLNMMSAYQVGGFVHNVLSPLWCGGASICCPGFHARQFWDIIDQMSPTWYLATTPMQSVILSKVAGISGALNRSRIRMVCNAGHRLSSTLERQLRDTFQCEVMPTTPETFDHIPGTQTRACYDDDTSTGVSGKGPGAILALPPPEPARPTAPRVADRAQPVPLDYEDPGGAVARGAIVKHGVSAGSSPDYLGEDGYLYVMGKSTEAISRAGKLISPFEIEAAVISAASTPRSPIAGRVDKALAFGVPHDLLGEALAVVIVTPPGAPRVDLKALHRAIRPVLSPSKWPVLIVYMSEIPKENGRVIRIELSQKLGLPPITDKTPYLSRHWEVAASAVNPHTQSSEWTQCTTCKIDRHAVTDSMRSIIPTGFQACLRLDPADGSLEAFLAPKTFATETLTPDWAGGLKKLMATSVHNYMIPNKVHLLVEPFPEDPRGQVDEDGLQAMLGRLQASPPGKKVGSTEARVTRAFALALNCKASKVPPKADFFALGGDEIAATKLVANLRAEFNVHLPSSVLFNQGTVKAVSLYLDAATHSNTYEQLSGAGADDGCEETRSSTNPLVMLLQLLPIAVFYPIRRATQWSIFLTFLSYTRFWETNNVLGGRLSNLVLAITLGYVIVQLLSPFVGIAAKWIIIGRYREGIYPMWGSYHMRWWMVQKIVSLSGTGFFNTNDFTKTLYCRIMGAKIGKNVKFTGAFIGEWDLLNIGDGATLDRCTVRPFAVERNTSMYLGRISIGRNASVGLGSYVAAGTEVPEDTCIGLNSSSWELEDANESNRTLSSKKIRGPHWALTIFLTIPIYAAAWFFTLTPWFAGLTGLVIEKPLESEKPLRDILSWFPESPTVVFHYLAMILRVLFSPYLLLLFTVFIRFSLDLVFGPVKPGPAYKRGQIDIWRGALIKTLLPDNRLREVTEMFGQHYEFTSATFRILGSKVGRRVRWPWQTPAVGDYHMLEVGDDVVFGNRVQIVTSDGHGWDKVCINDRAVVADGACLLPGVVIGADTAMECGALTKRCRAYPTHGIYIGSQKGDAVCLTTPEDGQFHQLQNRIHHMHSKDTLVEAKTGSRMDNAETLVGSSHDSSFTTDKDSMKKKGTNIEVTTPTRDPTPPDESPYARAFYQNKAPYYVLGPFIIWLYSTFMSVFGIFFWNIPIICSIKVAGRVFINHIIDSPFDSRYDPLALWAISSISMIVLTTAFAVFAVALVVGAKWLLLGRGQPGNHDYDKTSYCQRRQLFLTIERLIYRCYRNKGIIGLLSGTHWLVLYYRALGAKMGKDCAIYANGRPSLAFTEPDMITLGDRVALDDATILAHNDVRGKFHLDAIKIGDRCVLRSGSSILSGAEMKNDSCLLEHTVIMSGDTVDQGVTMQGWPAEKFTGKRTKLDCEFRESRDETSRGSVESRRNNSDATLYEA